MWSIFASHYFVCMPFLGSLFLVEFSWWGFAERTEQSISDTKETASSKPPFVRIPVAICCIIVTVSLLLFIESFLLFIVSFVFFVQRCGAGDNERVWS